VLEAPVVVRQQRRVVAAELIGAQQQFGEIHHAGALALRFVFGVDPDELPARGIARVLECRRPVALVLVLVDEPLDLARHPAGLVELHGLDDFLDEPQLVLAIEDLEALRQIRLAPVQAQQPVRDAVERAHPHGPAGHT